MRYMCLYVVLASLIALCRPLSAEPQSADVLRAITRIRATIPATARTARLLGTEREGSGVVIDAQGHVLTIGYLILEADTITVAGPDDQEVGATFVGYDHSTGFGLIRVDTPLGVRPMALGQSTAVQVGDPVLVASHPGPDTARGVRVAARQEFAGYWEYLLEDAIFTIPPLASFSGAALIDRQGQLVGIGSLWTSILLEGVGVVPGNMFVPIDHLKPMLQDLIATGRSAAPPKPWLGVNVEETHGRLFVRRVTADGPAERAGLTPGDLILQVEQQDIAGLADFYRKVWARGQAGVAVPLRILQGTRIREITVHSTDRHHFLGLRQR